MDVALFSVFSDIIVRSRKAMYEVVFYVLFIYCKINTLHLSFTNSALTDSMMITLIGQILP